MAVSLVFTPSVKAEAADMVQTNLAENSITLHWTAEPDAMKYNVYVSTNYSDSVLYTSVPASQTYVTISNLPAGAERSVTVKYEYLGYDNQVDEGWVDSGEYKTLPGKVTNVKQERWYYFNKCFYAEWDKMECADGYECVIKTTKGKTVKQESTYGESIRCSNVSNQKIYTVQVRAYTTINGQKYYGAWSDKAYCFTQPRIKSIYKTGKKITVKWAKVEGATAYDIYVSTKPKTGYKKVKTVKKNTTSCTIKKIGKKKISAKKKYYVYIATVKKVGSRRYDSGRLYFWNTKSGANYFDYF